MAETLVENRICDDCGADVRPGALFCYSCGGSVSTKNVDDNNQNEGVSEAWFRENISGENGNNNKTAAIIVKTPSDKIAEIGNRKSGNQEQTKLKSAASLRRKAKTLPKKDVEIVWEEHEAPNIWFILVALLLTAFAGGIVYLAMYLK